MFARVFTFAVTASLGLSLTACSALTRPDEITIAAEPLPSPNAPAAPAVPGMGAAPAPGAPARPAAGGG